MFQHQSVWLYIAFSILSMLPNRVPGHHKLLFWKAIHGLEIFCAASLSAGPKAQFLFCICIVMVCFLYISIWIVLFFCLIDCCGCCYLHMCSGRRRLPTSWQPHMRMRGQATYWALFSKAHLRVWIWCPSKCFLNMLRICQRCGHRELELAPRARHCDTSDNRA